MQRTFVTANSHFHGRKRKYADYRNFHGSFAKTYA